jgi:hypothetical protein
MRRWRRSGRAGRGIHDCDGVVIVARFLDVCVVRSECLRVVVVGAISLLLRALLLFFVELALVLLVFGYAGLRYVSYLVSHPLRTVKN